MTGTQLGWKEFLEAFGYYAVSFTLGPRSHPSLLELREWMSSDQPRYTGWSPFWWPTRREIEPKVIDQSTYECLHDGTGMTAHIERWRASTSGAFTIVRAHDEDRLYDPGKFLELTLPVWRVGELLLYSGRMAQRFKVSSVDFILRYEGLAGRLLSAKASPNRILSGDYTTKAQRYEKRVSVSSADIESGVVEITEDLVRGLFDMFQFTLPSKLCEQELTRMKANRF